MSTGGTTIDEALAALTDMSAGAVPIGNDEYAARIARAQAAMRAGDIAALWLNAGTNLFYFTGMRWHPSERMVGAILPAEGALVYLAPAFEEGTLLDYMVVRGAIHTWHEHENPYALFVDLVAGLARAPRIGIDESTPFFITNGIRQAAPDLALVDATPVTAHCRARKSAAEIALMQRAMDMTLTVHIATASILHEGITTLEVEAFIDRAHRKVGAPAGSYFCIVLFGAATAFPHGVSYVQSLAPGDTVLIDTGCKLHHYISDITRTYVFGAPSERQRHFWALEQAAQQAAFAAARLGVACEAVDAAARGSLAAAGLGPDYQLPGLPHRTGHGIGLDIHEWPYLVGGNRTPLDVGMCFSNEPMICVPGEFGIRLEDHFYMTEHGPRWFTPPAHSIDDPFALAG